MFANMNKSPLTGLRMCKESIDTENYKRLFNPGCVSIVVANKRYVFFLSPLGRPLLSAVFINISAVAGFPHWWWSRIAAVWSAIQVTSAFNGWFIRTQQGPADGLQDKEPVLNRINTPQ